MDRKQAEQEFHDHSFGQNIREPLYKYYRISRQWRAIYLETILKASAGRTVMEYGCGSDGGDSFAMARGGAQVTGIDLSPVAVSKAQELARQHGLEARAKFVVNDAEHLEFPDAHFDAVVGSGILHHLDLAQSLPEIRRVLKPGGAMIFLEPLAHNPLLAMYRLMTPSMRTRDEHPLTRTDILEIGRSFHETRLTFFGMLSLLNLPLVSTSIFDKTLPAMDRIDALLFKMVPPSRWLAWQVLIVGVSGPA